MQNSKRELLRRFSFAFCILSFACVASAQTTSLSDFIGKTISEPGVRRGTWGIVVHSIATNERVYEHNPATFLVPASLEKLLAAAAAVEAVGWDYTFETRLHATGPVVDGVLRGDLIVVGSGDPALGGRAGDDFSLWIEALKAAGIRRIRGRIVGDDDAFEDPRPGAMWSWDDLGYGYGALYGALNYAENKMAVTITPAGTSGIPARLSVEPHAVARPLINRTTTGAIGSRAFVWAEQRQGESGLTIAGSLPVGAPPARLSVSAGNPTVWTAGVLRHELIAHGIEVTGAAVDIDDAQPAPDRANARVLYTSRSHRLADIAQAMLKDSIDMYAEGIFRLATGPMGGRSNDDALEAVRRRLPEWSLGTDALQPVDGSGLSRRDTIAADAILAILLRMYDPSETSPWMSALPLAGHDGTLDNRFTGTAAAGNVRAKTGTMSNIRSLAGYVRTRDGEPLAFTIIVNNFEGTGAQAQAAIDAIVVRLAEFSRAIP